VFGRPTGLPYPGDYWLEANCEFVAAELISSGAGIVAIGGGMYSLSYSMIIRELSFG